MKIFNCIFGIFSIVSAVYCILYLGMTFLNCGWIVAILLVIWGICTIANYAAKHGQTDMPKGEAAMGILGLIAGIAVAVVSWLAMFMPSVRLLADIIVLCIFACWLIGSGISSIVSSLKAKKQVLKSGY